jgi:hypothetical protein
MQDAAAIELAGHQGPADAIDGMGDGERFGVKAPDEIP